MTPAQLAALKTNFNANMNVIPVGMPFAGTQVKDLPNTGDGNAAASAWYNLGSSPDFWVWRTGVTKSEFTNSVSVEGTTFNWVGNGFITRSVGEQTAWSEIFDGGGSVNASLANVRQAFSDIFSGTGNAAANRTHLLAVARRKATNGEKLFAVGTGSTASPAVMGFEGNVATGDIEEARNLP